MAYPGEGESVPATYVPAASAAAVPHEAASDDLSWDPPRWVLPVAGLAVAALLLTCFLVFWQGMGTAPRESAVEAFGVVFGLLVAVSAVGAFRLGARRQRPGRQ
ncbi:hypothetical protein [Actinocatenispora rupis]|uniref:hypothetical protein n=1 Tax=Actinocatenispora rupis TaxID=519421 RepID=UPI001942E3D7|nr:hypothetical protein [Actinocatenispora rupis]